MGTSIYVINIEFTAVKVAVLHRQQDRRRVNHDLSVPDEDKDELLRFVWQVKRFMGVPAKILKFKDLSSP